LLLLHTRALDKKVILILGNHDKEVGCEGEVARDSSLYMEKKGLHVLPEMPKEKR
jgi:hypothetical protein